MFEPWAAWSLRRRLELIAGFAIGLALVFGGIAIYWAASTEDDQMLDARLEQLGATIGSFVDNGLAPSLQKHAGPQGALKTRPTAALLYRYQVWSRSGALLLRSHEAPADRPLTDLSHFGFQTVHIGSDEYRTFSLPTRDGQSVVQVGESIDERPQQVGLISSYYVACLLLPFGIVFAATRLLLRRTMRSVDTLAGELQQRNPLDVSSLHVERPPEEMLPILKSLDMLFARIGRTLSIERRFTSVAAHEMRTPLAGLRAQAQLACAAHSETESREALGAVIRGVDRASHVLDQLLDLARVEALTQTGEQRLQRVRFNDVYQNLMMDLGPRADAKWIQVSASFEAEYVSGVMFGVFVLMRNLLANAILYSPDHGRIAVASQKVADAVVLTIDDSGKGIPSHERERAFERFNRLGQGNKGEGVGLGLSIVLMVVELHDARIQLLDSPLGGLRAQVRFSEPAGAGASTNRLAEARADVGLMT